MKISLLSAKEENALKEAAGKLDLREASRTDLAVFLALAEKTYGSVSALSRAIGETDEETFESLLRMKELGIVSLSSEQKKDRRLPETADAPAKKKKISSPELPPLTTEQTAQLLKSAPEIAKLMDAIEQTMGQTLSTADKNRVFSMIDYLGLESDYILLLVSHCAAHAKGRLPMASVESQAVSLVNRGIVSYRDLEEYLIRKDAADALESRIRTLFGLGSRSLSKQESETVARWVCDWKFSEEMIELARDTMVNSKGGIAKISYVNSILRSWHEEGYKRPEDVQKKEKAPAGTFDTDEFFEEALSRSYGESRN